jgi:hypothetical protein
MPPKDEETPKKKKQKRDDDPEPVFDAARYFIGDEELPYTDLRLDMAVKHGQVRAIDIGHRDWLLEQYTKNPPTAPITLVTTFNQGVLPPPCEKNPTGDMRMHVACMTCMPGQCAKQPVLVG